MHSFVILYVEEPFGDNITSMWFFRDDQTWQGYAWRHQDQRAALESVRDFLSLSPETDDRWPVDPEIRPDGTMQGDDPENIEVGVF